METNNRNEFEKKPLVHAHVNAVAEMLKREFRTRSTSEFWHIPKNAVFPKANPQGIYDWVLAESVISKGKMLDHRPLVAIEYKPDSSLKVWPSPEEPMDYFRRLHNLPENDHLYIERTQVVERDG